jgi:uncharacterized damage-inducible protein DinB
MNANEILVLNLEEIRRRSIKIWREIPPDKLDWKPDAEAMSCLEMIRHVLEADFLYSKMMKSGGTLDTPETPFTNRTWTNVEDELAFAESHRKDFIDYIKSLSTEDLAEKKVNRSERGYIRPFGDFVLRIGYHESVHAGQMLDYLRTTDAPRANIWD